MIGILLVSHNGLAEAMLSTAKMLYGEADNQVVALGLEHGINLDDFDSMLSEAIQSVDTGDGVFVLVDLLGGTPCNRLARFATEKVVIITGMNLGMFLEIVCVRDSGDLNIDEIVTTSKDSIVFYNSLLDNLQDQELI